MRRLCGVLVPILAVAGCAGSPPAKETPGVASPAPAAISTALRSDSPAADAPPEFAAGFGRLVGTWRCTNETLQADGSWETALGEATWTWFYTLGGHAIEDFWEPSKPGAQVGINLRLYDGDARAWHVVWADATQHDFDHFTAEAQGADIVMHGERFARPQFRQHQARITFHHITPSSFSWRYEAAAVGGNAWREVDRLSCRRPD